MMAFLSLAEGRERVQRVILRMSDERRHVIAHRHTRVDGRYALRHVLEDWPVVV